MVIVNNITYKSRIKTGYKNLFDVHLFFQQLGNVDVQRSAENGVPVPPIVTLPVHCKVNVVVMVIMLLSCYGYSGIMVDRKS